MVKQIKESVDLCFVEDKISKSRWLLIAGDKRSPQVLYELYNEIFPESVHILSMPVLLRDKFS